MNNINSADNARTVVTDTKVTKTDQPTDAARSGVNSGKDLPAQTQTSANQTAAKAALTSRESTASVEKAVEQLNDYVHSTQRDLRFSLDEDLGRTVVRVLDRNTQEMIRQIPNETALRLARNLKAIEAEEMQQLQSTSNNGGSSLGLINTRI